MDHIPRPIGQAPAPRATGVRRFFSVYLTGIALIPLRPGGPSPAGKESAKRTVRDGWASDNPAIRQMFASTMFSDNTKGVVRRLNEMQRASISPDNAYRFREAVGNIDVSERLPRVVVP